jgi:hypothetical protein
VEHLVAPQLKVGVLFLLVLFLGNFGCAGNSNPQKTIDIANEGPQYTKGQTPACVAPISTGCLMPTGVFVYQGLYSSSGVYVALYGYTSSSTFVNFNYLLMGL